MKILTILPIALSILLGFGVYQFFYASSLHAPESVIRSYVFYLHNDYIRNGTSVRIEILFDWQAENLSTTVTVNDDEYNEWDYVGLVFDVNKNGKIDYGYDDEPCIVHANNLTRTRKGVFLQEHGLLNWVMIDPMPSSFHTCTFVEGIGYTFKICLPRQVIGVEPPMPMHICFVDYERWKETNYSNRGVWVQFKVT